MWILILHIFFYTYIEELQNIANKLVTCGYSKVHGRTFKIGITSDNENDVTIIPDDLVFG